MQWVFSGRRFCEVEFYSRMCLHDRGWTLRLHSLPYSTVFVQLITTEFGFVVGSTGSDDPPPPKPSRFPILGAADSASLASLTGTLSGGGSVNNATPAPTTYIVAQNPEVLVQLLRENESRGISPSVYTTPASAFNTLAVDFEKNASASASATTTSPSQTTPAPPQSSPVTSSTPVTVSQSPVVYGVSKKVSSVSKSVSSPPVPVAGSQSSTSSPTTSPSTSSVSASIVAPIASPVLRKASKPKTKEMGPYHSSNSPVVGGVCVLPPPPNSLTSSPPAAVAVSEILTPSSLVSSATSDGATLSSTSFTSSYDGGPDLDCSSAQQSMNGSSVKVAEDDGGQVWVFCMHLVQKLLSPWCSSLFASHCAKWWGSSGKC